MSHAILSFLRNYVMRQVSYIEIGEYPVQTNGDFCLTGTTEVLFVDNHFFDKARLATSQLCVHRTTVDKLRVPKISEFKLPFDFHPHVYVVSVSGLDVDTMGDFGSGVTSNTKCAFINPHVNEEFKIEIPYFYGTLHGVPGVGDALFAPFKPAYGDRTSFDDYIADVEEQAAILECVYSVLMPLLIQEGL